MAREHQLADAFVELADTLVSDYDVVDLLDGLVTNCVSLLEVAAAGLMLSDQRGSLQVLASSTEQARLLELFQLQSEQGPCLECFGTGQPVTVPNLAAVAERWPVFVPAARDSGYAAVCALPLRLREQTIGALNLFSTTAGDVPAGDVKIAQAMADVATIGILQERAIHRNELLTEQLQGALNSRVVIEQAKGVLTERGNLDTAEAFSSLRAYARSSNSRLAQVAADLVAGNLAADAILGARPAPRV